MRIVIAPDKFKDCLAAAEVAGAIAAGLRQVDTSLDVDLCPMADGGEGTVAALVAATGGTLLTRSVTGPLPDMEVDATFGFLGDGQTAVIEMSAASGLALLGPHERNPLRTTTFGTGELIVAAVEAGAKRIILGIGGSATTDAGLGAAQACGASVVMDDGTVRQRGSAPVTGADVEHVVEVKGVEERGMGQILVACDVTNPLFGPTGAACVFSPQKGATAEQVRELDRALAQLAERTGTLEVARTPGAGAAGGLGFGMMAFVPGTQLRSGIEIVMEAVRLRDRLAGADLCITGEGKLDAQSLGGKTPIGVARVCREMGIPCVAVAGTLDLEAKAAAAEGLSAVFGICPWPMTLEQAMREAKPLLARAASNILGCFLAGRAGGHA